MSFDNLLVDDRDGVRWLTVNRPAKLNALNVATVVELEAAVTGAIEAPEVLAVVVTGAGEKSFVAGADIAELNTLTAGQAKEFALRGQRVFNCIERSPKPVVAAVNGFAFGGGCELAMACHVRIAASNAVFGQPEVKLGLIPGYGGTQRLPRLVGGGRALELLITGRNVSAEEALQIGLVTGVYEAQGLADAVDESLRVILGNGPLAVSHCIEALNHGAEMSFDDGCLLEATLFGLCAASDQMAEGTDAFLEKRKPKFKRGT